MTPRITVITTNYNYAHLLGATIRSVLAQDYTDIDYIVVDDGSTDDSLTVARSFAGVRVIAKPNGGQVSAAMAAIPYITGDVVVFLDSDDRLYPHACSMIAARYAADVTLYQFGLDMVDVDGNRIGSYPDAPLLATDQARFLDAHGFFPASPTSGNAFAASHVRRMLAVAGDDLGHFVDGYLIYSAAFFGRIEPIGAVIGRYLVHGANVSLSAGRTTRSAERMLRNAVWQRRGIVEALHLRQLPARPAAAYLPAWDLRHLLILRRCYGVRDIVPELSDLGVAWRAARKFLTYPGITVRQRAQNLVLLAALLLGDRRLGRRVVPPVT